MVEAGAGCAKTSTLKLAAPGIKVPALGLAFNKRIAEDMRGAVPEHISIKTLNGLGHGAWLRQVGGSVKLDDRKLSKIVTEVLKNRKVPKDGGETWDAVRSLVRAAMAAGLVPAGCGP